jgi:hypothetical protein
VLKIESETPKDVEGRCETTHGYDHDQQTQTRVAGLDSISAAPIESRQQKAEHHHATNAENQNKSHVIFGVVLASRALFQEYSVFRGRRLGSVDLRPATDATREGNLQPSGLSDGFALHRDPIWSLCSATVSFSSSYSNPIAIRLKQHSFKRRPLVHVRSRALAFLIGAPLGRTGFALGAREILFRSSFRITEDRIQRRTRRQLHLLRG